jgi:hypothetical protein
MSGWHTFCLLLSSSVIDFARRDRYAVPFSAPIRRLTILTLKIKKIFE